MTSKLETLKANLEAAFGGRLQSLTEDLGQITIVVKPAEYLSICKQLRDDPSLRFEQCMDVCGLDYSAFGDGAYEGPRFAAVLHLLSVTNNWRLRVRVFAEHDDLPIVPSVVEIWNGVNWFEREAFDLYGIVFDGHPDLRRILTDYGFIGHPFRKDFPLSGYVEMRYDPEEKRVVYQPVTIEPREITPRVIREDRYGGLKH
ncbi:NADH-quinone oxidoreductase subunit C [Pararobbsia silviterrae]|uniref:NADH-quinone oxidoreductase subunit C n=1 Tax=Pararobbsia silviterrae TaxID=1792498 RepID=A0A494Y3Y7_9BURK|nr:NADH-quinone oxidoreductase subunit C [Pararobbsia silviterrae]RKP57459.1 NADH-quinone oxidoreductase subunit C [Pararobbsia silviterrae]